MKRTDTNYINILYYSVWADICILNVFAQRRCLVKLDFH